MAEGLCCCCCELCLNRDVRSEPWHHLINDRHRAAEEYLAEVVRKGKGDVFERASMEPLLDTFFKRYPNYAPAWRLRGLIYNWEVSCALMNNEPVAVDDPRFQTIRESYEAALAADPKYTLVLVDLGDYWSDQSNFAQALNYYNRALQLLKDGHFSDDHEEELQAAYRGKIDTLVAMGHVEEAEECRAQAVVDCAENEDFI